MLYFRHQSLPELADLPPKAREALWAQAKRDPFGWTDFFFWAPVLLTVVIGGACGVSEIALKGWDALDYLLAYFVTSHLIEVIFILRYRPVLRQLRQSPAPLHALAEQLEQSR